MASKSGQLSKGNTMYLYRIGLVAFVTLFAATMASVAFAGCGACGGYAVTYAPVYAPPALYAPPPPPPVVYVPAPVVPLAAAPIVVDHWDTGGCGWGCGGCGNCGGWGGWSSWGGGCGCGVYAAVPAPLYVVNQGPQFSGPGVMVPFQTYSPYAGVAGEYPYVGHSYYRGYGHPYYGAHYAYHPHRYWYRRPYPHHWRG